MLTLCFAFLITSSSSLTLTSAIKISTSLGDISGSILTSRLGEDFYAFRGIRYAQSPEGELRFQNPKPVKPWAPEIFDATNDGPRCPQPIQSQLNLTEESEDCLRLNVYTKNLNVIEYKPVIIYIHGGRFIEFSGESQKFSGPQILMDRDIVLVTFNYRLGSLGFLATGTADAPGNAGLKDQVAAFKWVKDHIHNFGGDSSSITLLGYDAGSISIGLHLVSPMTKGLFHRAIAMSGSAVSYWNYSFDQMDSAKKLATALKCPTNELEFMMKCLKESPTIKNSIEEFGQPVIERDFGQERFIVEDPVISFLSGKFHTIPLIVGMTKDEVEDIVKCKFFINKLQHKNSIFLTVKLQNFTDAQLSNERFWKEPALSLFRYASTSTKSKEISAILKKEYFEQHNSTLEPIKPLAKMMSDRVIGFPVHRFAHLAARFVPVYYYMFSYQGRYSYLNYSKGAFHYDDLQYLFYNPNMAPMFTTTDPENKIIDRLTGMWTKFAATGDPNIKNLNWKPLNLDKENYLDIGDELILREKLLLDRFDLWDRLFPVD
ncbi:juvenile hormone esterase-like [Episyrphus balteatus]|uniref:juvenile hormone esterase-like n=1 Tax=Episyrphus balteatus TaxID=286459 RepID=UPI002485A7FC|nr:juvenile hormone esterase-like [Episyrphus balteatus]